MDVSTLAPFSNVECPSCAKETRVKREFGPYTLLRRHAIGGMSVVFIGIDNTLGREVALKILNEDYSADERRIEAFEEEARITASFSHPHVVRVFTTGKVFGRFYIAMELVAGGHFEQQIREKGTIPEIEMLPLAIQVAEGLEAARAAGLIHRDIKPGNILLDAEGHAKIVDFGLALVTKGGTAQAQEIWATPYYVPPETIEGAVEDFRSDLYAFGATLYHALAGKPPCDEESMATDVLREAKKKIVPLKTAAPFLSAETCAIIDRLMAYEPKDRFGSYEELIKRLTVSLKRVKAAQETEGEDRIAAKRRSDSAKWALASAAVVLLGTLITGIWWVQRVPETKAKPVAAVIAAPEPVEPPEIASLIAKRYREARAAVTAGDYEKARAEFSSLRDDSAVQEPTRTWAGVEAVVAAYLEGESAAARQEAGLTLTHLETAELPDPQMAGRMTEILKSIRQLPAIAYAETGSDAVSVMGKLLTGLKNWDQGASDAAAGFFRDFSSANLTSQDQWMSVYQKIALSYLADYEALQQPVFEKLPETVEECQSAIQELEELLPTLKTKGRARFNVRAWQLDLTRHARLLEQPVAKPVEEKAQEPVVDAAEVLANVRELQNECRFSEAAALLKTLRTDPDGFSRESMLSLTEAAESFLGFLEVAIGESAEPVSLRTKSGEVLTNVKVTAPGVLTVGATGSEAKEYRWSDIAPDAAIEFYRSHVRSKTSEIERLQRHESAIAYDWLVGDRTRATAAAERLSLESLSFKARWRKITGGLTD